MIIVIYNHILIVKCRCQYHRLATQFTCMIRISAQNGKYMPLDYLFTYAHTNTQSHIHTKRNFVCCFVDRNEFELVNDHNNNINDGGSSIHTTTTTTSVTTNGKPQYTVVKRKKKTSKQFRNRFTNRIKRVFRRVSFFLSFSPPFKRRFVSMFLSLAFFCAKTLFRLNEKEKCSELTLNTIYCCW